MFSSEARQGYRTNSVASKSSLEPFASMCNSATIATAMCPPSRPMILVNRYMCHPPAAAWIDSTAPLFAYHPNPVEVSRQLAFEHVGGENIFVTAVKLPIIAWTTGDMHTRNNLSRHNFKRVSPFTGTRFRLPSRPGAQRSFECELARLLTPWPETGRHIANTFQNIVVTNRIPDFGCPCTHVSSDLRPGVAKMLSQVLHARE